MLPQPRRRDGRVAEGARLESVYTLTGIVGSNPTLSASLSFSINYHPVTIGFFFGPNLSRLCQTLRILTSSKKTNLQRGTNDSH